MNEKWAFVLRAGLATVLAVIPADFYLSRPEQTVEASEGEPDVSPRLDALLKAWENSDQNIRQVHYVMEWTTEDRVLKEKHINRVEGFVKKPQLARVDMKDDKGKASLILLLNDKTLEFYNVRNEQRGVWEIPPGFPEEYFNKGWIARSLARTFEWNRQLLCFEFPVSEIHERFDARLTREDKYWAYIELIPKTKESRSYLRKMEVVLDQKSDLVRQYRVQDANGNWSICDFQKVEINPTPPITLESISKDLPKGFKEVYIPSS